MFFEQSRFATAAEHDLHQSSQLRQSSGKGFEDLGDILGEDDRMSGGALQISFGAWSNRHLNAKDSTTDMMKREEHLASSRKRSDCRWNFAQFESIGKRACGQSLLAHFGIADQTDIEGSLCCMNCSILQR